MAEACAKIEELLSAYLDGRLSPKEKARVSAHLESCPACATLLDKMHKLDEMASSAMDAIDDSMLEKLERRIQADIDRLPTVNIEAKPKTGRVIPVWYRYVAVAASLVLMFMIGRAFYKSGGLDETPSGQDARTKQSARPPMMATQPASIPVSTKPDTVVSETATGGGESDRDIVTRTKPAESKKELTVKTGVPVSITGKKKGIAVEKPPSPVPQSAEAIRIVERDEMAGISRDKEAARNGYADAGKVMVAPSEDKQQAVKTDNGTVADRAISTEGNLKSMKVDVPTETGSRIKEPRSMATADEKRGADENIDIDADAVSTIERKAGQLKAQAVQELGKLGYNSLVAGAPMQTKAGGGTLHSRYLTALAAYKSIGSAAGGYEGKPKGTDSTAAARYVLGQADRMPESTNLENQSAKLYLTLRAANDLYRFTGEASYRDRAMSARDALLHFLDTFSGDSVQARTANTYRTELQGITIH